MFGWVGDKLIDWRMWLYTDADFAAEKSTFKTVSGVCRAFSGPTLYSPFCAWSKKQGAVSHPTVESEMVAANLGLRTEALPIRCLFLEDNQATLRIVTTWKTSGSKACSQDPSGQCSLGITSMPGAAR